MSKMYTREELSELYKKLKNRKPHPAITDEKLLVKVNQALRDAGQPELGTEAPETETPTETPAEPTTDTTETEAAPLEATPPQDAEPVIGVAPQTKVIATGQDGWAARRGI